MAVKPAATNPNDSTEEIKKLRDKIAQMQGMIDEQFKMIGVRQFNMEQMQKEIVRLQAQQNMVPNVPKGQ